MTTIQELNPEQHHHLHIDESKIVDMLSTSHLLFLRANEIPQAACTFPVFFTRESQQQNWTLSALCAFAPAQNLYVKNSEWLAEFTPKSVKTQPLTLLKAENDKGYAVGINPEHPVLSSTTGEKLFTSSNKASLYLTEKCRLLESTISDDSVSFSALKTLNEKGLIADIDMIIEYTDGSKQPITGMATVNEAVLNTLNADDIHRLQKDGILMFLHAMLMSLYQVNSLIRLHNNVADANHIANIKFESPKNRTAG